MIGIHQDQLARYGGQDGIRDPGLLVFALAQPRATYGGQFLHADLVAMAAAHLVHVIQNHPFVDGDKRTGAMAAYVFLALNGLELEAPEDDLEALVCGIAKGEAGKDTVSAFLRRHTIPAADWS